MHDRLRQINDEYETLEAQLSDPEVLADPDQLRTLSKRYTELGPVVETYRRRQARAADADAARSMLPDAIGDERDLLAEEIDAVNSELAAIDDELRELMLPSDPHDGKNVIVEIRGAEGGEEANLFARDLFEMYQAYALESGLEGQRDVVVGERHGWVQRHHVRSEGRHRVAQPQVRGRTAPRATGAGHREPGPHPHLVGDGHGAAGGRRGRRADRRPRSRHRRVPGEWAGRSGGQHDRLGGAHHPPAERARGLDAGRALASCRTGRGRWSCCAPGCSNSPSRNATRSCRRSAGRRSAAAAAARRSAPTTTRRTVSPITASASRSTGWRRSSPAICTW